MNKEQLLEKYYEVQTKISSLTEDGNQVNLIAVSKLKSVEEIEALYQEGQRDFGENYTQDLIEKAKELEAKGIKDIRWHFLGKLQTNKIKSLLSHVYQIHSLDSVRTAIILSKKRHAQAPDEPLEVFLQINLDDEATKNGFSPEELTTAIEEIRQLENLFVIGFMCIPKVGNTAAFVALKTLTENYFEKDEARLSMGMSADYEDAIRAGATDIRVGTAIFGERN